ncbi:MAG TPA: serine/threonine-protein kinase, partial [Gemmatimonadaceae bacterium]|nr:serine/threonine-protein kinase [Gemmatimonadaceae bacterium]
MTDLRDQLQQTLGAAYTLERELGGGGMARVFVAEETALGRMVVVKVLPPDLSAELSVERFRREARLAAGLQHPHVVPVLATGGSAGVLYYTMPFVEGESLRVWLERERQLPVLDAVQLAREVAEALAYAHGRGVVHRDVKPENILLSGGHALLTDFGIAKALEHARGETLTATGLSLGTPNYMAPEQAAGERDVDGRADIYALGCVLYEMLAGKPPFNGPTAQSVVAQHLAAPFPQVRHSRPDVPEAIDEVIRRATAKAPADRYPTAAAFAAGLAAPLSEPAGGRASGERTTRTARGRGPMRAAIGVAAVLILGIGGWLRVRGSRLAFDQNLIAIGPFEVLDPQLQLWREGMADVLARNLDGAGALRTVAPTTVLRRWRGPSDLVSAAAISRSTGARYVVLGRLSPSGRDTLRLTAEVADAATNRSVATIELRDAADHVDRLADSASVGVLREFERVRRFSGARLMSIGTRSLPALKAFLTGEQFYRRNEFDSALVEYRRAIEFDSTFALALRRAAWAIEDPGYYGDPLAMAYALRAGRFNRGLSVRDSLLVLADSIYAAEPQYDPAKSRRHIAVLTDAARRYPDDVDVWYALACALIYEGYTASDVAGAYPAFQRVVAIDSEFLPGLSVASFMAIQGDKIDDAIRYARMYAKLRPSSATPRIILNFVDRPSRPSEALALADTVSAQSAVEVLWALGRWIDSTEAGVQVARRILKRPPAANTALWEEARRLAVWELAHRGHMAEAIACAMAA